MKKFSIIIPLFNVKAYATETAASIKNQGIDDIEVILIDDGSTDNSLKAYQEELSGFDVLALKQKNAGPGIARNAGIVVATGEYTLFLDSDDMLLPGALVNILDKLESEKPDVLFGRYVRWLPPNNLLQGKQYEFSPPVDKKARMNYILGELPESSWNAVRYVCNTEFLKSNNLLFDRGYYTEDLKWVIGVLEKAASLSFLSEPFYAYRMVRPGSLMNTTSANKLISINDVMHTLINQHESNPLLKQLFIRESFMYVCEYCRLPAEERKRTYESFKKMMPLYGSSKNNIIRKASRFRHPTLFFLLAVAMFFVRSSIRLTRKIRSLGQ